MALLNGRIGFALIVLSILFCSSLAFAQVGQILDFQVTHSGQTVSDEFWFDFDLEQQTSFKLESRIQVGEEAPASNYLFGVIKFDEQDNITILTSTRFSSDGYAEIEISESLQELAGKEVEVSFVVMHDVYGNILDSVNGTVNVTSAAKVIAGPIVKSFTLSHDGVPLQQGFNVNYAFSKPDPSQESFPVLGRITVMGGTPDQFRFQVVLGDSSFAVSPGIYRKDVAIDSMGNGLIDFGPQLQNYQGKTLPVSFNVLLDGAIIESITGVIDVPVLVPGVNELKVKANAQELSEGFNLNFEFTKDDPGTENFLVESTITVVNSNPRDYYLRIKGIGTYYYPYSSNAALKYDLGKYLYNYAGRSVPLVFEVVKINEWSTVLKSISGTLNLGQLKEALPVRVEEFKVTYNAQTLIDGFNLKFVPPTDPASYGSMVFYAEYKANGAFLSDLGIRALMGPDPKNQYVTLQSSLYYNTLGKTSDKVYINVGYYLPRFEGSRIPLKFIAYSKSTNKTLATLSGAVEVGTVQGDMPPGIQYMYHVLDNKYNFLKYGQEIIVKGTELDLYGIVRDYDTDVGNVSVKAKISTSNSQVDPSSEYTEFAFPKQSAYYSTYTSFRSKVPLSKGVNYLTVKANDGSKDSKPVFLVVWAGGVLPTNIKSFKVFHSGQELNDGFNVEFSFTQANPVYESFPVEGVIELYKGSFYDYRFEYILGDQSLEKIYGIVSSSKTFNYQGKATHNFGSSLSKYAGLELPVTFNVIYLGEALATIKGTINLKPQDNLAPVFDLVKVNDQLISSSSTASVSLGENNLYVKLSDNIDSADKLALNISVKDVVGNVREQQTVSLGLDGSITKAISINKDDALVLLTATDSSGNTSTFIIRLTVTEEELVVGTLTSFEVKYKGQPLTDNFSIEFSAGGGLQLDVKIEVEGGSPAAYKFQAITETGMLIDSIEFNKAGMLSLNLEPGLATLMTESFDVIFRPVTPSGPVSGKRISGEIKANGASNSVIDDFTIKYDGSELSDGSTIEYVGGALIVDAYITASQGTVRDYAFQVMDMEGNDLLGKTNFTAEGYASLNLTGLMSRFGAGNIVLFLRILPRVVGARGSGVVGVMIQNNVASLPGLTSFTLKHRGMTLSEGFEVDFDPSLPVYLFDGLITVENGSPTAFVFEADKTNGQTIILNLKQFNESGQAELNLVNSLQGMTGDVPVEFKVVDSSGNKVGSISGTIKVQEPSGEGAKATIKVEQKVTTLYDAVGNITRYVITTILRFFFR